MPAQLSQTSHSSSNVGWTDSAWYIQSPANKVLWCAGPFYEKAYEFRILFITIELCLVWINERVKYDGLITDIVLFRKLFEITTSCWLAQMCMLCIAMIEIKPNYFKKQCYSSSFLLT